MVDHRHATATPPRIYSLRPLGGAPCWRCLTSACELDLVPLEGDIRTISLEPGLRFQMKGLGYGHPKWKQGAWIGELEIGSESFDPAELDLTRPENLHVQQIVRATDGSRTGIGVLEQIAIGPHSPSGLTGALEGFS